MLLGERPPALPAGEMAPSEYGMGAVAQVGADALQPMNRDWQCNACVAA